jgi:hypothetical protein
MKKLLSVALIATMLISCFAFTTFAETTYDSTWTIKTDKDSYKAGDYLVLTVMNSTELANKLYPFCIHITFDKNMVEYVTDFDELYDAIEAEPNFLPGEPAYGTGAEGGVITKDGEFSDAVACTGANVRANRKVYTLYFKVKEDIKGTNDLNFRWVLKDTDIPSYAGYQFDGSTVKYEYNIKFVDKTVTVVGDNLAADNTALPEAKAFAAANDFEDGKVDINGTEKTINTAYAAAFGTVVPRNGASRVKAGFLLSTESTGLTVDNTAIKNFEAANFASNNVFGGLFYGPGLEAGKTYYVMPYVTYSDNVTLYAPSAVSFTMPN